MSTKILYGNVADDTNMQGYKYWSTVGRYPVYFVEDSEDTNPIVYCISTLQKECKVIAFEENTVLQSKLSDLFDGIQYTTSDFDLFDKVLFESDSSDSYINWYLDLMNDVYTLSHVTCIPDGWAMSAKINSKFNALCVEMEGAAVAQVCYLSLIPFLIVRSISDIPNNDNVVVYEEFVISSSKKVAHFVNELISTL